MAIVERECPLLLFSLDSESFSPKFEDLSAKLEKGDDASKMTAIREIIHCIISGLDMSRLTMQVIKFCLRSKSCEIKKLLQIYWEVLDKTDSNGKLKPEMILVCNHLLQDLKNANEFIRGSTCRLLCRINEPEILEQLIPQLILNLEHRHSYVRKNAVLAVMAIYTKYNELIPDAATKVFDFLMNEGNMLSKRNGFLMLTNCDLRNALDFFLSIQDKISSLPESMQIVVLELTRKVCRALPVPKSIFVKCAASLLDANSNAVVYEAANTLLSLTPLDSAVNRALEAYVRLLQSESDQNVKLIVIHRLNHLKSKYLRNLRHVLMDILRALNTPNLDIKKEILSLVLDLATNNNIEDIITCLKKEIILTNENNSQDIAQIASSLTAAAAASAPPSAQVPSAQGAGAGGAGDVAVTVGGAGSANIGNIEYNNLLVETIHECAVKFPKVASSVVHLLINYLAEDDVSVGSKMGGNKANSAFFGGYQGAGGHGVGSRSTAYDVILFVREIVQEYADLRESILLKLIDSFSSIKSEQVYRVALWILGEYCDSVELIESLFERDLIVPLSQRSEGQQAQSEAARASAGKEETRAPEKYTTRTVVLDDGTYAQETIVTTDPSKNDASENVSDLLEEDAVTASTGSRNLYKTRSDSILNTLIKSGEYYLSTVLATTVLKLVLRLQYLVSQAEDKEERARRIKILNRVSAQCLLTLVSVLKYGDLIARAKRAEAEANAPGDEKSQDQGDATQEASVDLSVIAAGSGASGNKKKELDKDSRDRLNFVIRCLLEAGKGGDLTKLKQMCLDVYLNRCQASFGSLLSRKRDTDKKENEDEDEQGKIKKTPFDKMISFGLLSGIEFNEMDEDDVMNVKRAAGAANVKGDRNVNDSFASRLSRVHQLTGFSDPIYAEACVTVHQFDIILDILIINNTENTLQNVSLELHTSGDLKLVDKPSKFTLGKKSSKRIQASIKVSSTENGVIFGCIVFDTTKASKDENIVVMNCIHMDIMDYTFPDECGIDKFRDMWVEFEWENKVPVNTDICDLKQYLQHVANITNMKLLTEMSNDMSSNCQFLAANLHAKSIFGEHALMNVSIELKDNSKVTGHIRIRCKSQGIALSLGEKITNKQRKLE